MNIIEQLFSQMQQELTESQQLIPQLENSQPSQLDALTSTLERLSLGLKTLQQSYETLAAEREFLQSVIDVNPNIIFVKDKEGRFVLANPACAEFLGSTVEEVLSKTNAQLGPSQADAKKFEVQDQDVIHTLQPQSSWEEACYTAAGELRWYQTIKKPILSTTGKEYQVFGSCTDITQRKLAEEKLRYSETELRRVVAEKETLLRETHHRVKNNLQLVSSLLELQAQGRDPVTLEVLKDCQRRIQPISLIHEQLYSAGDLTAINLADYLRELLSYLFQINVVEPSRISYQLDLDEVILPIAKAIPCSLIVNELVSNCFKHAFLGKAQGKIEVLLKAEGETVMLTVKDDGVGFPADWNLENTHSLGLQLVQVLGEQIQGSFELKTQPSTEICFWFPLSSESATLAALLATGA